MGSARLSPGLFVAVFLAWLYPLACASNTPPPAYASTRGALAELDEY
jgi:hypothetical protein